MICAAMTACLVLLMSTYGRVFVFFADLEILGLCNFRNGDGDISVYFLTPR